MRRNSPNLVTLVAKRLNESSNQVKLFGMLLLTSDDRRSFYCATNKALKAIQRGQIFCPTNKNGNKNDNLSLWILAFGGVCNSLFEPSFTPNPIWKGLCENFCFGASLVSLSQSLFYFNLIKRKKIWISSLNIRWIKFIAIKWNNSSGTIPAPAMMGH